MSKQKKQSFLGGAAILTAAVVIVKLIGAVYKLPLNNILGSVGKTYFDTAYLIYNFLMIFSTAGLPLAISKLTSQAHAQGRENQKRKIFSTSVWLFFILGLVGSLLMFFGAEQLAAFEENPMAAQAIRALAPAVFCVCLLACMRGYTQGQGNMKPTAISQVLEALCKVCIGLPLAWFILQKCRETAVSQQLAQTGSDGVEYVAAGAILGVTVGTILSLAFLIVYLVTHHSKTESLDTPDPSGTIMKSVLAIGIPITLGNSALGIINLIDTKIVMGQLQNALLLSETEAALLNGQYRMAMDMPNMVASFVYPVTMSLIPFAAAAMAQKDTAKANSIISSAFRLIAILALPAGVGLSVLSTPIMRLLLPTQQEDALAAGPHLQILGIALVFICLMILTNAILQTYGKEKLPIFTVIAGGITKIVMNYILVGNPDINIHGAPISTLCCYMVIVGLNLFFVWKYSPEKPRYLQIFLKPVAASVLMGAAAWAVHGFAARALAGHSAYLANAAATFCGILAGVVVYAVLVIALRILRAEDVRSIPHGETLIKLLHLK
ncbi:polysaccharide biosynthesis protein [Oscillibacter valericigenes]|uniref:putative polysaccharide biosynthesis protein n=1 Tax=Oscillibacter valericigenes TaxID=351091 RepID=UPI001F3246FA|nr:polysaccharide biosynthesis protein [Oscillibacter valericigenes]MCF2664785.1 polysaccharide biosynthesis protein [Oscillibacter valericigenes]